MTRRHSVLVCHLRPARRRARHVAVTEALCLLGDLQPVALAGGPLSEQGGVFWLHLPAEALGPACERLPLLGYTRAVDLLEPASAGSSGRGRGAGDARCPTRWRGASYELVRVYEEDAALLRERAPDRRVFLLETGVGDVRPIVGYRGDGGPLSRRGLPVCDARLLVNLVRGPAGGALLDPFAGVGGVVLEAVASGWRVASGDRDRALRHGLSALGAGHAVADVRDLPFGAACFDAIATEPPYDREAGGAVLGALRELCRVLKEGGRLALLCAAWQADDLRRASVPLGLTTYLDSPINRKGLDVVVLAWRKAGLRAED